MLNLYMRTISSISGAGSDDDNEGYGVFLGGPAMEACVTVVMICVLAASVIIWEACAFFAMTALILSAVWCFVPSRTTRRWRRASTEVVPDVGGAGGGLTDTAIDDALPASPYGLHRVDAVTCSVCLEDVRGGQMVRTMPECRHLFHAGCIDVWLRAHATCPMCRSDLSPRRRRVTAAAEQLPPVYVR